MKKNEPLTEEEKQLALEERKIIKKEEAEAQATNIKKPAKAEKDKKSKEVKKGGKAQKIEEAPIEEKIVDKPFPLPDHHTTNEIKEFLSHYQANRLLIEGLNEITRVRTEEEKKAWIKENDLKIDTFKKELEARNLNFQNEINMMKDEKEKIYKEIIERFKIINSDYEPLLKQRDDYKGIISNRKAKFEELKTMIDSGTMTIESLTTLIDEAKALLVEKSLIDKAYDELEKLKKLGEIEENLRKFLADKELESLKDVYNQILEEQIQIDAKLLNEVKVTLTKAKML